MKIAFYAPLKSPLHPVPSGDRLMARLLFLALEDAGHAVELVSELRSYSAKPGLRPDLLEEAKAEREGIAAEWAQGGAPDLWFTYHPYYKAPDLLGPTLSSMFSIPYVTAEASYSHRRNGQGWQDSQALVLDGLRQAGLNICMTKRDMRGLEEVDADLRVAHLPPFIDAESFEAMTPKPEAGRLMTVAMMRAGDKLESYQALAAALTQVTEPWHLTVIGDGPERDAVEALFQAFDPGQVQFLGERLPARVASELSSAALLTWPGCGEAYGLAYLEAQAAGVPVVAFDTAGVPEVVLNSRTGVLTPDGDVAAYASAISSLLRDEASRTRLARGAREFALGERGLPEASKRLAALLLDATGERT